MEGSVRLIRSDGGLGGRGALAEALKQGYESRGSVLAPRPATCPAEPWCRGSHRSDVVSMNPNSALPHTALAIYSAIGQDHRSVLFQGSTQTADSASPSLPQWPKGEESLCGRAKATHPGPRSR